VSDRVVGIEREDVLASAVGAAFDLRDDGRDPCHLGVPHDPRAELRADDAEMSQLVATWKPPGTVE
jgi:hypothetical protein